MEESATQLNDDYLRAIAAFRESITSAITASRRQSGRQAGERRYWASVIFLRVCLLSSSLGKLCPEITGPRIDIFWDFASIASLARNLFECLMFFNYLTERCGDDEWTTKLNVMQLHDCNERITLFTMMKKDEDVAGFQREADRLKKKLANNPFFNTLDAKLQKTLLQGHRASIMSLREIVSRYISDDGVWIIYQLLSTYIHSFPVSFYRTYEQKRDGTENDVDKGYIAMTITWITELLNKAIAQYENDFEQITDLTERFV